MSQQVTSSAAHWLTSHAIEAMLARDITPRDVEDALAAPDRRYASDERGEPRTVHQRGDIAVVTAFRGDDRWTVLTVLYRTEDHAEGRTAARWASADGRPSGRRMSRRTRQKLGAMLRHAKTVLAD